MDRFKKVKIASIMGIIGNLFLFIIKSIIGLLTNSSAMLADAFNSGGDIVSSIITFIGNKIASKQADDDHNLGHGKAEYVYSLIMSIIMIFLSLSVLKNSVISIFENEKYIFSIWLIIVCIVTIIVKFSLYIYTNKLSKEQKNLLLKANSRDHINDCLVTSLSLVSILFTRINIYFLDGVIGTLISIWIIISYVKIFKESYDVLMDKSFSDSTKDEVYKIIFEHKEIKGVQHFISTPIGYKYKITFTIFVDGNLSTLESHEIADRLENEINNRIDDIYLTIIHVNPYEE
ncbi:MAG: cation transporter [Bacilli bacterium]|nr:cation transporter [Bacilli bacterium]